MKKWMGVLLLCVVTLFSVFLMAQAFWGGKTLSADEVKKKWGSEPIAMSEFKNKPYSVKAKMAYSIMVDRSLIGKSYEEIKALFGDNDGFYFIDTFPTYIVQRGKNHSEETWQLVFRMNSEYKVRDIIMHKNCCEK